MLAPGPEDRVLEIGCGGGIAIELLCERIMKGSVTAIDRSPVMVRRARDRNHARIATGMVRVEQVALEGASFDDASFDRILAINVNGFWTGPETSLALVARMLAHGGMLCLVFQPPTASTLGTLARGLADVIPEHGFDVPTVAFKDIDAGAGVCLLARRRS